MSKRNKIILIVSLFALLVYIIVVQFHKTKDTSEQMEESVQEEPSNSLKEEQELLKIKFKAIAQYYIILEDGYRVAVGGGVIKHDKEIDYESIRIGIDLLVIDELLHQGSLGEDKLKEIEEKLDEMIGDLQKLFDKFDKLLKEAKNKNKKTKKFLKIRFGFNILKFIRA